MQQDQAGGGDVPMLQAGGDVAPRVLVDQIEVTLLVDVAEDGKRRGEDGHTERRQQAQEEGQ
jgi:hypothetical protein